MSNTETNKKSTLTTVNKICLTALQKSRRNKELLAGIGFSGELRCIRFFFPPYRRTQKAKAMH